MPEDSDIVKHVLNGDVDYHFQRHPRQPGAMGQVDYMRMAEAAAQEVAEIRALTGWLLREGCPAVALWGVSMGAWLTGMTVCRDARFAAAVMTLPPVRSNPSYADRIILRSVRKAWQEVCAADEALDETPFNLTRVRPAIPKENILLVEGAQDLVTPVEPIEELWQLWGKPDIWRLPHGHNSLCLCLLRMLYHLPLLRIEALLGILVTALMLEYAYWRWRQLNTSRLT